MSLRASSIEAAIAALSVSLKQPVLLIETCNGGTSGRYAIMDDLGEDVAAELLGRDLAYMPFLDMRHVTRMLQRVERSFDQQPGTCFGARIKTFEHGALVDIMVYGQDGMFDPE